MTEDARLTDFGGADRRRDGAVADDDATDGAASSDDGTNDIASDAASSEDETVDDAEPDGTGDAGAVAPVRSTYAWGDYACADCGASIDRAWRDGDAFVCASCKEW